jgi:uncharacterized protein with FMN-binding domain
MLRRLATLMVAGALVLPVANAIAATHGPDTTSSATIVPTRKVTTNQFAGITAQVNQFGTVWGTVQITITLRTTTITTGTTKKVIRKYTDLGGRYSYHTARSQFIDSQSLPYLRQEFLQAQSANVQMVSGATYTSEAFLQSLQSALLHAKKG